MLSLRSVRRWLARWNSLTSHVRAHLGRIAAPTEKTGGSADPMTLCHFAAAFPLATCPVAAFQERFQVAVTSR